MQILLIATDVDEVKEMVKQLDGSVGEIKVWLVGEKDRPGVFEMLRGLQNHKHAELDELRTQMKMIGGIVTAAVGLIEVVARVLGGRS